MQYFALFGTYSRGGVFDACISRSDSSHMRLDPAAVGLLRREVGETCGVIDGAGNCVEETEACQEPVPGLRP
jgi:hypothetical protein